MRKLFIKTPKFWHKFKNLFIPMKGDENFEKFTFFTSNNKNIIFRQKNKILQLNLKKNTTFYLVLNSQPKNFKKIKIGEGIEKSSDKLDIGLFALPIQGNINIKLSILEYDKFLNRVNYTRLPHNIIHNIKFLKETKFFVIVVELKGKGSVQVEGLFIKLLSNNIPNVSHNLDNNSKSDNCEKIKQEKEIFSRQAYSLKKTVLSLEQKIQQNPQTNIIHETLINFASSLNSSNGSYFYEKLPFSIGIITDIYMFNFYKDAFQNVFYLSPDNYIQVLEDNNLDFIFYITCWKGIEDEEWKGIKFREKPKKAFENIIQIAKRRDIKLVFQSIEDPSNFEYFLPLAKYFDFIFTSDTEMIDKYKKELNHEHVWYGEYGFNPLLNNPISSFNKHIESCFFAGSYTTKYLERCKDLEVMFDTIAATMPLTIADRNYKTNEKTLQYPEKYQKYIIPPFEHDILQKIHKLFKFNINLNSIKQSPTMCAMRVYELQAQATHIVSNYALSVFNKFPNISLIVEKVDFSYFSDIDSSFEKRLRIETLRKVMNNKTSFDILANFISLIDDKYKYNIQRNIVVLYREKSDKLIISFNKQTYKDKILISEQDFINNYDKYKAKYSFFTWFNDKNEYESNYLNDMINGFKYTNVGYITKNSFFADIVYHKDIEHDYTYFIKGIDKTVFRVDKYLPTQFISTKMDERLEIGRGYSIDPYELNYLQFRDKTQKTFSYKISIIIPVYNNGEYLQFKCIHSLLRNKLWNEMEILLIDDGSTDTSTLDVCKNLAREFKNIVTYFYEDGGSGSASRPRNKGIELASCDLITFLDPDNEISPGGYDKLYSILQKIKKEENIDPDFISGYNIKVDIDTKPVAKHTNKEYSIIKNFKANYFDKGRFITIATQAALLKKELLVKNHIRFIERSAGQDTVFGWELLLNSKIGIFTSEAFITYYAQREGSVTNVIDIKYFDKKLLLEQKQVEILKKFNLYDIYINKHFDNFMNNWYLKKFAIVAEEDKKNALSILKKICILYEKDIEKYLIQ
jgi:glycosyltransferase involved in cell wall biosynthesis